MTLVVVVGVIRFFLDVGRDLDGGSSSKLDAIGSRRGAGVVMVNDGGGIEGGLGEIEGEERWWESSRGNGGGVSSSTSSSSGGLISKRSVGGAEIEGSAFDIEGAGGGARGWSFSVGAARSEGTRGVF